MIGYQLLLFFPHQKKVITHHSPCQQCNQFYCNQSSIRKGQKVSCEEMREAKKVFSIKQFILGKKPWLTKEKEKDKKLASCSVLSESGFPWKPYQVGGVCLFWFCVLFCLFVFVLFCLMGYTFLLKLLLQLGLCPAWTLQRSECYNLSHNWIFLGFLFFIQLVFMKPAGT